MNDEMIHGTPLGPDIDGVPIDQDEEGHVPWWFWVAIVIMICAMIYVEVKYAGSVDWSGNLTR